MQGLATLLWIKINRIWPHCPPPHFTGDADCSGSHLLLGFTFPFSSSPKSKVVEGVEGCAVWRWEGRNTLCWPLGPQVCLVPACSPLEAGLGKVTKVNKPLHLSPKRSPVPKSGISGMRLHSDGAGLVGAGESGRRACGAPERRLAPQPLWNSQPPWSGEQTRVAQPLTCHVLPWEGQSQNGCGF